MKNVKKIRQYPYSRARKKKSNQAKNRCAKPKAQIPKSLQEKSNIVYHRFAKLCSDMIGNPVTFIVALVTIFIWVMSGPFFHYSNTWQLIINTGTTVITFLIVFIIQNTINRENETLQIKLDELIKVHKKARNAMINLENLSDSQVRKLEKKYNKLGRD